MSLKHKPTDAPHLAGVKLKGTLLFCAVSDEEDGGEDGAK